MKNLNQHIATMFSENKQALKSYATSAGAEKAIEKAIATYLGGTDGNIQFLVLFVESTGRWVPVVRFNDFTRTSAWNGGYVGPFASQGFMQI